ncbi:MAG: NAD(P)-dependent oxidoreductase [Actinomycetota bacterium]
MIPRHDVHLPCNPVICEILVVDNSHQPQDVATTDLRCEKAKPGLTSQREGDRMRLGFIGLGSMGSSMAANLIEADFPITVHNRTRERERPLLELGATSAASPAEVGRQADTVVTMVSDTEDVEEVLFGPNGLASGLAEGALVIDMSTISAVASRRFASTLKERDVGFLDAPVSGGTEGAKAGTLTIFVGGDRDDFERARPVLERLGSKVTHFGSTGAGQTVKAVNQVIVASTFLAVAEGIALSKSAGLDPELTIDAISQGLASSWILENRGPRMIARDYPLGFKLALHRKDLRIALEQAADLHLDLPGTKLVSALEDSLMSEFGDQDMSSIYEAVHSDNEP